LTSVLLFKKKNYVEVYAYWTASNSLHAPIMDYIIEEFPSHLRDKVLLIYPLVEVFPTKTNPST